VPCRFYSQFNGGVARAVRKYQSFKEESMQAISIATNEASIVIHLDKRAVSPENVEQTFRELQLRLHDIAERGAIQHPKQDLSFLRTLPSVSVSAENAEMYKHHTF
jgi:hypothetical protein